MLFGSVINKSAVFAPVLSPDGAVSLRLILREGEKFSPISSRLAAIIADPDTVNAIYVAWEAIRVRIGTPINGLSIDLDDESFHGLSRNKLRLEGDSISLAAFISFYMLFNNQFSNYQSIVATGAIRKKPLGYSIDRVEGVREKLEKTCLIKNPHQKTAIVVPKVNVKELDIANSVNDIWTVNQSLDFHCQHTAT
tara:strand:- start:199 stop:783 length:585 start_codon:yes stop_codon:yes gene_type:complete